MNILPSPPFCASTRTKLELETSNFRQIEFHLPSEVSICICNLHAMAEGARLVMLWGTENKSQNEDSYTVPWAQLMKVQRCRCRLIEFFNVLFLGIPYSELENV